MLFVTLEPNESADDDLPRNVAIITLYGAYRFMTYAGQRGPIWQNPYKGHKSGYPTTLVVVMYRVRGGCAPAASHCCVGTGWSVPTALCSGWRYKIIMRSTRPGGLRRRRESWREPLGRRPVSCDRHDARATNPSDRLFHSEEMPQRTLQLHALFPVRSTMVTGSINPLAPRTCGTLARPQR